MHAGALPRKHAIMKTRTALLAACGIALSGALFGADLAHAGGLERIGTLPQGRYECGMPGDATGQAWVVDPRYNFSIASASRYETAQGMGTYLLIGQDVIFTRGPMKDMRLRRQPSGLLQQTDENGTPGRLRCNRIGS